MWIFLPGGLIMPSQTPMAEADAALTEGRRGIQVRARLTEHLEYFRDTYVAPFTDDYSVIEQTPQMDYNCRFYMTHEEFALALGRAAMDIDYRKFKPTAEGIDPNTGQMFKSGRAYHNVLNSIWGTLLKLAPAGGHYGPRSKDNPIGYEPTTRKGRRQSAADQQWWETHHERGEAATDIEELFSDQWSDPKLEVDAILAVVKDVPADEWEDYLTTRELDLVQPEYQDAVREQLRIVSRRDARRERKANKKARFARSSR